MKTTNYGADIEKAQKTENYFIYLSKLAGRKIMDVRNCTKYRNTGIDFLIKSEHSKPEYLGKSKNIAGIDVKSYQDNGCIVLETHINWYQSYGAQKLGWLFSSEANFLYYIGEK